MVIDAPTAATEIVEMKTQRARALQVTLIHTWARGRVGARAGLLSYAHRRFRCLPQFGFQVQVRFKSIVADIP